MVEISSTSPHPSTDIANVWHQTSRANVTHHARRGDVIKYPIIPAVVSFVKLPTVVVESLERARAKLGLVRGVGPADHLAERRAVESHLELATVAAADVEHAVA